MPTGSPARRAQTSIIQNPDTITASEYWGLLNQIYSKIRYVNDRARFDASIRDIVGRLHRHFRVSHIQRLPHDRLPEAVALIAGWEPVKVESVEVTK